MAGVRDRVEAVRQWAQRTPAWQVWERMLEIEFVDRSVALAGKAFVSFFPLVIVVAAFMPPRIRSSIFANLTNQLGVRGDALTTVREAFASSDDVRRATGVLGLVLTFFFASSFTTALQRVYLRSWRRTPSRKVGAFTRGLAWLPAVLLYMALLGGGRGLSGDGTGFGLFLILSLTATCALWWCTAWFMLEGQVRWRVLIPSGLITGLAMSGYTIAAKIWMPEVISHNETQFGFFGVALALVTWLSGAAVCILVGACAGPVLAEDNGPVGALIRGRKRGLLVEGARPSLPGPARAPRLRDGFRPTEDDVESP
ncbi:MAG TPA: YhjD/YihY/BrkB family envelope integrity protein [Dermatophilaceae bacterium]|nr:YhjD/YihY/BrkB family envelope integrity protein [Dermatophilaceae bacterium]